MDVSGLKSEEYSIGDEVNLKVVLLSGTEIVNDKVDVVIRDALGKKEIKRVVDSNTDFGVKIEVDFPSGLWMVIANYKDLRVDRSFLVGESLNIEFLIEGDELVIRNNGNVRYTKTISIKIGDKTNSYVQNIGAGDEKRLKLISPRGSYDIEVTDGKNTIRRQNIELFGTGNVVGAIDKNLVGYTGFAGADERIDVRDRPISLNKLPVSIVFVVAVFILGILVFFERRMARKKKDMKK